MARAANQLVGSGDAVDETGPMSRTNRRIGQAPRGVSVNRGSGSTAFVGFTDASSEPR
jgi:hypothetical protein